MVTRESLSSTHSEVHSTSLVSVTTPVVSNDLRVEGPARPQFLPTPRVWCRSPDDWWEVPPEIGSFLGSKGPSMVTVFIPDCPWADCPRGVRG